MYVSNTRRILIGMTDVDDIAERLNGLVTLLNMVGIDGSDQHNKKSGGKSGASPNTASTAATSSASSSSEAQLLELLRKLQQAQAESPEILEALKSPELRALATLAAANSSAKEAPEPEKKAPAPSLEDVMDDDDDNYPKIGPGYSDDISVVSDISTPTVMTKQNVADEEYYREVNGGPGALPPMNIALGGGPAAPSRPPMSIGGVGGSGAHHHHAGIVPPPKRKNLVSQVGHGNTSRRTMGAKVGGAAAQRRLNYQQAMAKLQSDSSLNKKKDPNYMENFSPKKTPQKLVPSPTAETPDPSEFFPSIAADKKLKQTKKSSSSKSRRGKTSLASQEMQDISFGDDNISPTPSSKKKSSSSSLDWGSDASGWPSFDEKSKDSKNSGSGDKDGFDTAFGASFGSGKSDPFKAPKSPKKKGKEENVKRFAEITITRDADGKPTSSSKMKKSKEKDKSKKKSRRASLGM